MMTLSHQHVRDGWLRFVPNKSRKHTKTVVDPAAPGGGAALASRGVRTACLTVPASSCGGGAAGCA
jgi:hypothetical protein